MVYNFIFKFYKPLQRYLLTCQANSAILGRFFLHWAAATLKLLDASGISKYFFLDHFSPSFLSQKWLFQELRFYSTYSSCFRWCVLWTEHCFPLPSIKDSIITHYKILSSILWTLVLYSLATKPDCFQTMCYFQTAMNLIQKFGKSHSKPENVVRFP